jgi:Peptidase family M1 domain
LRRSATWIAVLGLALAVPAYASDGLPETPGALLDRLEQAWTTRDQAGYLGLWVFPNPEARGAELEFTRDRFAAEELRLTVERPARFPGPVARVHAQVFSSTEPRARVEQFRFEITGSEASGWRITGRSDEGQIDGLVHVELDPAGFRADGLTLRLTDFELRMQRGTLFLSPASLGPTAFLFVGEGQIRISPGPAAERDQLRIFCDRPEMEEKVHLVFARIHPADLHRVLQPVRLDPDPGAASRWPEAQAFFKEQSPKAFVLDAPLPRAPWWMMPMVGDALVAFRSGHGTLTYAVNSGDPEDVSFFNRDKRLQILLYASGGRESDWNENDARTADIQAHDLEVRFEPDRFAIQGEDSLVLDMLQAATSLRLRLDETLRVLSVTSPEGGNHIFFRVRGQNSIVVSLGPYSGRTGEARLVVRYAGVLDPAPVEDETLQAVMDERRSLSDEELFIERVLLYTNKNAWYPRNLSDDHARYRARFNVPAGYTVVAGGRLERSGTSGDRATSEYRLDEPGKYLTAIVGRLVTAGKALVGPPTLTAWSTRRLRSEATATLATAHEIVGFFAREFGPCPYSFINVVLTENVTPGGHSPPGMVLVQRRPALAQRSLRDDPANFSDVPGFFLAHELAHQWWGQGVAPKNYRERWLSEGAAQYAAALWVRKSRGEAAFRAVLKRFGDWANRNAEAGPIDLSYRVGHLRNDPQAYRAIVYDKGACVLHMLREIVGDDPFRAALTSFQASYRYKKAGTEELREALESASGMDLKPYVREWVRGTAVAELRLTYRTDPSGSAFRTTVRVEATGLPGPVPLLVSLMSLRGRTEHQVMLGREGGVFTLESADRVDRVEINTDRALLARVKEG